MFQKTYILNWDTEINFYQGFYIRYGRFLDHIINQQGDGMGEAAGTAGRRQMGRLVVDASLVRRNLRCLE